MTIQPTLDNLMSTAQFGAMLDVLISDGHTLPGSTASYYRGLALINLGRPVEAIEAFNQASVDPAHAFWAKHWAGRAYEQLDDPSSAADAFLQASRYFEFAGNLVAFRAAAVQALARPDTSDRRRVELYAHLNQVMAAVNSIGGDRSGADLGVREAIDHVASLAADLEERHRDLDIRLGKVGAGWPAPFRLNTDFPIASTSDDHLHPRGTAQDNTRSPRFVRACERQFGERLKFMDLGCSGGGLVRDFLLRGHRAIGLEGSDFSLKNQRAEWRAIPNHLSTCDILKPFNVFDEDGKLAAFDVISAWEVLEHLPREALPGLFRNIRRHLSPNGRFVASVALFEDKDEQTGTVWHVTREPRDWWESQLALEGLALLDHVFEPADFVRGSGNGPHDWNAQLAPDMGFHVVVGHR